MSIPKIIHYCWFGKKELPDYVVRCIDSWKKYCPGFEIKEWNEDNYDIFKIPYIRDAYKEKKWAFVSDFVRLDVVYQYGGIYLDTDVELIKSLDLLLNHELFFSIEKHDCCINTGLGFGAVAGHSRIGQLLDIYGKLSFYHEDGSMNLVGCPVYTTDYFERRGFKKEDITQTIDSALILSSEYFCPMDYFTGKINVTENTYGIHWYEASWFPKSDKHIHEIEVKIRSHFSKTIGKVICLLYRKGYRFREYAAKGILFEKIKEKAGKR